MISIAISKIRNGVGTNGIRHRAATDIANSGVSVKVGIALTAHKTVTMFTTHVHTDDNSERAAADKGAKTNWPMSEQDALDILTLMSLIHRGLDRTQKAIPSP